jgi:hypothetical protein
MSSSLGKSKGPCWSSSSSNIIGSLPYDLFSPPFSSTSNTKFLDNIFFLYHGMGVSAKLFLQELAINIYVHQIFFPIWEVWAPS